ncbi:tripartite-type tricarboxylate transporter receptor subunit TctC [Acidovorax soli]|uniref:Tripartite-type tricarboxylate transporter receptor subunit TctC n=1 Tax=Acidovorax soli TaxID=592050 RepID=A0A7X0P9Q4_9BURK|nr:tripartite tricarboxylate transporter substrate binding protein [Acidovorax soli]MBB6557659.1 tripartite-type tricarboxylate transporter receptor subunit TctC [Acidovorax soli]
MPTITRRTAGLLALAAPFAAWAQPAPGLPLRITTVFPTGSGPDVVARIVGEKLQARWGRAVVIDAKPGGAGMVAINGVKGAAPNGSELVVVDVGNMSINPLIFKRLSYDPDKDLVPVALLYKTAFFVAVGANSPHKSVQELMVAAADKRKQLTYGSNAVGGPIHLASERLAHAAGVEMVHVPFKETSQLYTAVATGEVDWAFGSIATAGPLVRGGRLRLLAVADSAKSPAMPEVPTLESAGGPKGLYASTWVALMAPRGTPAATAADINKAVNEALALPDVREKFATFGFVPHPGPAQQVLDLMQEDRARYAEVVKRVKISID